MRRLISQSCLYQLTDYEPCHHPVHQEEFVDDFPINPRLRSDFDRTPHHLREELEITDWWGKSRPEKASARSIFRLLRETRMSSRTNPSRMKTSPSPGYYFLPVGLSGRNISPGWRERDLVLGAARMNSTETGRMRRPSL